MVFIKIALGSKSLQSFPIVLSAHIAAYIYSIGRDVLKPVTRRRHQTKIYDPQDPDK
jgi:hypothetical protein